MPPILKHIAGGLLIAVGLFAGSLPILFNHGMYWPLVFWFGAPFILLGATLNGLPDLLQRRGMTPRQARKTIALAIGACFLLPVVYFLVAAIGGVVYTILLGTIFEDAGSLIGAAALLSMGLIAAAMMHLLAPQKRPGAATIGWTLIAYGAFLAIMRMSVLPDEARSDTNPERLWQIGITVMAVALVSLAGGITIVLRAPAIPAGEASPANTAQPAMALAEHAPEHPRPHHLPEEPFDPAMNRRCPDCGYVMDIAARSCPRCSYTAAHPRAAINVQPNAAVQQPQGYVTPGGAPNLNLLDWGQVLSRDILPKIVELPPFESGGRWAVASAPWWLDTRSISDHEIQALPRQGGLWQGMITLAGPSGNRTVSVKADILPSLLESLVGAISGLVAIIVGYLPLLLVFASAPFDKETTNLCMISIAALGAIPGALWMLFVTRRWTDSLKGALAGGIAIPVAMVLAFPAAIVGSLAATVITPAPKPGTPPGSGDYTYLVITLCLAGPAVGAVAGLIWGVIIGSLGAARKALKATIVSSILAAVLFGPAISRASLSVPGDTATWMDLSKAAWQAAPYVFCTLALSAAATGALMPHLSKRF